MTDLYKFDHIMIIDDNPIDLYIAGKLVANHRFAQKAVSYNSAEAALAYLEQQQNDLANSPQIIFVDIYMPLMSGFEFLERYALLPAELKSRCRVYVVSSSIDEHDIQKVHENPNVAGFGIKTITKDFLDSITAIDNNEL